MSIFLGIVGETDIRSLDQPAPHSLRWRVAPGPADTALAGVRYPMVWTAESAGWAFVETITVPVADFAERRTRRQRTPDDSPPVLPSDRRIVPENTPPPLTGWGPSSAWH